MLFASLILCEITKTVQINQSMNYNIDWLFDKVRIWLLVMQSCDTF